MLKTKGKKIAAVLLAAVMAVPMFIGNISPTFAAEDVTGALWSNLQQKIYAPYKAGEQVPGYFYYSNSFSTWSMGEYESAYEHLNAANQPEYFVLGSTMMGNVFRDLTGPGGAKNNLVCGGEDENPAKARIGVISSGGKFLAGPYKTASDQTFYYMDAPAGNAQGIVGDYLLQGPETGTITDITVLYNAETGAITETPTRLVPEGEQPPQPTQPPVTQPIGPDINDDYYVPTETPNIFEVVDEDGNSQDPPKFVFDRDKDTNPLTGGKTVVEQGEDGKWYTENPKDIYREINENGAPKSTDEGIWVGEDGIFGNEDDKPADKIGSEWFADMSQNIFTAVTGDKKGELMGGGGDKNPTTNPAQPVHYDATLDQYFIGPIHDNSDNTFYYYGDAAVGGNGMVDSESDYRQFSDQVWYKDSEGNMTTEKPVSSLLGPDADGNYFQPTGDKNIYEVVDQRGDSKNPEEFILDQNKDKDNNPATQDQGENLPLIKDGDDFYAEQPDNIFHEVKDGKIDEYEGIWGGADGKLGGGDDMDVEKFGNDWFADKGQNIYEAVTGSNAGGLVSGGPDNDPSTNPGAVIEKDSEYYVGPMKDADGDDCYYGVGADNWMNSDSRGKRGDDTTWYIGDDGSMTTEKPNQEDPINPNNPDYEYRVFNSKSDYAAGDTIDTSKLTVQYKLKVGGIWAKDNNAAITNVAPSTLQAGANTVTVTFAIDGTSYTKTLSITVEAAGDDDVVGPLSDGKYYKQPEGENPYVYEVVDQNGNGTGTFVYDTDNELATKGDTASPANFQEVRFYNGPTIVLPGNEFDAPKTITTTYFLRHSAVVWIPVYPQGVNYLHALTQGADNAIGGGDDRMAGVMAAQRKVPVSHQNNWIED